MQFDKTGTGDVAESDLSRRYLWEPGTDQLIADEALSTFGAEGGTLWALTDHLGTIRDYVDDTGALQNHIEYDALGNVVAESNATVDTLFGFTGKAFDVSTGRYNRKLCFIEDLKRAAFLGRIWFEHDDPLHSY